MWWDGPYMHPKDFSTEEINVGLIDQLRGYDPNAERSCDAPGALQASAILLPAVRRQASSSNALHASWSATLPDRLLIQQIAHPSRKGASLRPHNCRCRLGLTLLCLFDPARL